MPFHLSPIFVGKVRRLLWSGVPERRFTYVRLNLTSKHKTKLDRTARDKHTSLLNTFINYDYKIFITLVPGLVFTKLVLLVSFLDCGTLPQE